MDKIVSKPPLMTENPIMKYLQWTKVIKKNLLKINQWKSDVDFELWFNRIILKGWGICTINFFFSFILFYNVISSSKTYRQCCFDFFMHVWDIFECPVAAIWRYVQPCSCNVPPISTKVNFGSSWQLQVWRALSPDFKKVNGGFLAIVLATHIKSFIN